MLRTNSKKLNAKLDKYIMEHHNIDTADLHVYPSITNICDYIYEYFKKCTDEDLNAKRQHPTEQLLFVDWSKGLPTGLFDEVWHSDYYRATDLVGDLLEQTEEERKKYNNDQAGLLFTGLLYKRVKFWAEEKRAEEKNPYYHRNIYHFIEDYKKKTQGHFFDDETLKFFGVVYSSMKILKDTVFIEDYNGKMKEVYILSLKEYDNGFISKKKSTHYKYFDVKTLNYLPQ